MSIKIVESKFKKLVVSGCSFTYNNHYTSCAWANLLADWAGMELVNLAIPGAGNSHIATSLILYLERYRPDPKDTLVMAMWSGIDRADFVVSREKYSQKPKHNREHFYDKFTQHYMVGGFNWAKSNIPAGRLTTEYHDLQDNKSAAVKSWLDFGMLTNYLNAKSYNFRYTGFLDILHGKGLDDINLLDELDILNLSLDQTNWILTQGKDPLGEYATYLDELYPNDRHPTRIGQERWVKEKLIPALIRSNILTQKE